jgi:hypothetical protein
MTDVSEQEQERYITRPLEDPYLVGEVAAARARTERLARESGDDILLREDRQWDWFLGKLKKKKTSLSSVVSPLLTLN